jgi:hypothetical protein
MQYCLIIILVLVLIWFLNAYFEHPEKLTMSKIDGNVYSVKEEFDDYAEASDILARLNNINKMVIAHMRTKYKNTDIDVEFLVRNYNGNVLTEHIPKGTTNTSYVINKGDIIKLCLRSPLNRELHDFNTLTFVNLHELSHLLDKKYGHGATFWSGFKIILENAVELGLYHPVNYSKTPTYYCGMYITNSPLF